MHTRIYIICLLMYLFFFIFFLYFILFHISFTIYLYMNKKINEIVKKYFLFSSLISNVMRARIIFCNFSTIYLLLWFFSCIYFFFSVSNFISFHLFEIRSTDVNERTTTQQLYSFNAEL